jgi:hypothetical protein
MPATATKERPILMAGAMVCATLDDIKTKTRRIIKPQPRGMDGLHCSPSFHAYDLLNSEDLPCGYGFQTESSYHLCPYGKPGDHLWVREAWNVRGFCFGMEPRHTIAASKSAWVYRADDKTGWQHGWKPSIHMPRWASRLTLEVVSVVVERLQDISEADAIAEGAHECFNMQVRERYGKASPIIAGFASLWESINGSGSWKSNPWVWVVEFKREATNA